MIESALISGENIFSYSQCLTALGSDFGEFGEGYVFSGYRGTRFLYPNPEEHSQLFSLTRGPETYGEFYSNTPTYSWMFAYDKNFQEYSFSRIGMGLFDFCKVNSKYVLDYVFAQALPTENVVNLAAAFDKNGFPVVAAEANGTITIRRIGATGYETIEVVGTCPLLSSTRYLWPSLVGVSDTDDGIELYYIDGSNVIQRYNLQTSVTTQASGILPFTPAKLWQIYAEDSELRLEVASAETLPLSNRRYAAQLFTVEPTIVPEETDVLIYSNITGATSTQESLPSGQNLFIKRTSISGSETEPVALKVVYLNNLKLLSINFEEDEAKAPTTYNLIDDCPDWTSSKLT